LDNVAAGSLTPTSLQAINGAQLNAGLTSVANSLGGGSTFDPATGAVTGPAYAVQGGTHSNAGDAFTALDTALNTAVNNIANGTSGLVQQTGGAPGTGQITVGANTGGTSVNVAGTGGNRVVTGVANGAVNATSTDAVNGSQLNALQQTLSTTAAATQVNINNAGQSAANHLGGGSTYNPATGQISAPTYNVGGQAYQNVGTAIAATNMLAVQYVTNASGQPTNAVRLGAAAGALPVALGNVAAGAVNAASTDAVNGGQLHAVQTVASGALQRTGGTLSGNLNLGGNRVTGLAGPVDASDAATKGYVDGLQSQNANNFNLLTSGLNSAFKGIERNSQGVALAIAMGGGFLSDDKDFSLWGAWGNFNGYNAAALQSYIRLNDDTFVNVGLSYGFEESLVGTRVGFGIQF
jgi:autotransporter adhesin